MWYILTVYFEHDRRLHYFPCNDIDGLVDKINNIANMHNDYFINPHVKKMNENYMPLYNMQDEFEYDETDELHFKEDYETVNIYDLI